METYVSDRVELRKLEIKAKRLEIKNETKRAELEREERRWQSERETEAVRVGENASRTHYSGSPPTPAGWPPGRLGGGPTRQES